MVALKEKQPADAAMEAPRTDIKPEFFDLRAQLVEEGRDAYVKFETDNLEGRVKVYASGGENEIHAHMDEDHAFIIMQGKGTFYGPNGEERELGVHEGINLPAGSFYRFHCTSPENLVLLRISAKTHQETGRPDRMMVDGSPIPGHTKLNKWTAPVHKDEYFE